MRLRTTIRERRLIETHPADQPRLCECPRVHLPSTGNARPLWGSVGYPLTPSNWPWPNWPRPETLDSILSICDWHVCHVTLRSLFRGSRAFCRSTLFHPTVVKIVTMPYDPRMSKNKTWYHLHPHPTSILHLFPLRPFRSHRVPSRLTVFFACCFRRSSRLGRRAPWFTRMRWRPVPDSRGWAGGAKDQPTRASPEKD